MTKTDPLVTDEQLRETDDRVRRASLSNYAGLEMIRDHYEAHLTALLKERNEAMRLVMQSEGVLIEARVYVDANRDDVRGEYITDTWEEDVERSVSNINATLGSISTFLSTLNTPKE